MDSDASRKSGTNYSDTNSVESPLSVALDLGRLFVAGDGGVGRVRWVRRVSTNCLKPFCRCDTLFQISGTLVAPEWHCTGGNDVGESPSSRFSR